MMRKLTMAVAFALVGATASAQDVKVDFDKDANFAAIKTFAAKIGTAWNNPIGEKRVLGEIEEAIAAKGWAKAEEGKADAIVVLHGAGEKQKSLNTFYSGGYGGYGWRGWGGGMGSATTTVSEYMVGTLVVDIFDVMTKQLLFRGQASDQVSSNAEKNTKTVYKAMAKMFKAFPPSASSK